MEEVLALQTQGRTMHEGDAPHHSLGVHAAHAIFFVPSQSRCKDGSKSFSESHLLHVFDVRFSVGFCNRSTLLVAETSVLLC
jgi:hypothetical protein